MVLPTPKNQLPAALFRTILEHGQRFKVVDVGANPLEGKPAYANLADTGDIDVVGFEPNRKCLAELNTRKGPNETYLPHVIGDGGRHTLRMCSADGMSSLFEPNAVVLNLFHLFPIWARVKSAEEIQTMRLDDIPETAGADFLKMDIQGAELMALHGAVGRLRDIVAVQTEVIFVQLYKDQPSYSEIEQFMRRQGFMLHRFIDLTERMISPFSIDADPKVPGSQIVWADAIFVRNLTRLDLLSERQLLVLANIACDFYQSHDLALLLLREHDRRDGGTLAGKFLFRLQPYYDQQKVRAMNFDMPGLT